ncbi:MAG TPA: hypothetical protein EYG03_05785 [Planctomycetes bacterium]|nr:hypothetical protein [Fuerstiella sp.]HIK91483.1 hypothetical protein [Planctomycetota bacterium]
MLFAVGSLLIAVSAIGNNDRTVKLAESLSIAIREGQFQSTVNAHNSSSIKNGNPETTVKAGKPFHITFTSTDYVYIVQQPETNTSVVVLPGATATMSLTMDSGTWSVTIMQGCGRLFSDHDASLILRAVK